MKAKAMKEAESISKFMQLLTDPNRIEIRPDGWFWDKLCGVDRAPLDKIKHLNTADGAKYAVEIGGRLPDDHELSSLIDYSKERPAIIEPFKAIPIDDWYLTRTPFGKNSVWCVAFHRGYVLDLHSGYSFFYVWPVRSSQCQFDYLSVSRR